MPNIPTVSWSELEIFLEKASLLLDITSGTNVMINANIDRFIIAFMKKTKGKMMQMHEKSVSIYNGNKSSRKYLGLLSYYSDRWHGKTLKNTCLPFSNKNYTTWGLT